MEINADVPGFIKLEFYPDKDNPELTKYKSVLDKDQYSKTQVPKGCVGTEFEEFEMMLAFSTQIQKTMERAEGYVLNELLGSKIPPKAEVALSKFWLH